MASASNGSDNCVEDSGNNRGFGEIVDNSCKQVVKDIVKEINDNMAILFAQLSGLGKGM